MTNRTPPDRISTEEVEAQAASQIPDKEAMSLLNVNADLNLALDLAAPVDAAVAANANAAVPVDAAVSANAASTGSSSVALADQGSSIHQDLTGTAVANGNQTSTIAQGTGS
jgi:hypothetical protein